MSRADPSGRARVLCIRSAAVRGHELHLYAGSGFVRGASPEDEWRETEAKMQPLVDVADELCGGSAIDRGIEWTR